MRAIDSLRRLVREAVGGSVPKRRRRLSLEPMEDRVVPAFDLLVMDNGGTNKLIDLDFSQPGLVVVSPADTGAILDLSVLQQLLETMNVRVMTGSSGSESGDINITGAGGNLDYSGAASRDLTLRPDPSALSGRVLIDSLAFNLGGQVNLAIDTSAKNGRMDLLSVTIANAMSVNLDAGTGDIFLTSQQIDARGPTVLRAATVSAPGPTLTIVGDSQVTVNAAIDLAGNNLAIHAEGGTVSLNGPVAGANDLDLFAAAVQINAAIGTGATPIARLTFHGNGFGTSTVTHGPNPIAAAAIHIGNAFAFDRVIFNGGTGTLTGNVTVDFDGVLAPGGIGAVGTLTIDGNLKFADGEFAIDLGPTPDLVVLVGMNQHVNILGTSALRTVDSTGKLPGPGDFFVIEVNGPLSSVNGSFINAPVDAPFLLGTDAIRVTHYGPFMSIGQVPAAPGGVVSSSDFDGTRYTIKLTGPGEMATFGEQIVLRNTTLASQLSVTTVANASDAFVGLGNVVVNGSLGKLIAPKADFSGRFE